MVKKKALGITENVVVTVERRRVWYPVPENWQGAGKREDIAPESSEQLPPSNAKWLSKERDQWLNEVRTEN